jgi:hypothetical protein
MARRLVAWAVWITLVAAPFPLYARRKPHFIFTLPDNYVGWVKIIFAVPGAPPLQARGKRQTIRIEEDGIARTSSLRIDWGNVYTTDEFFYRHINGHEVERLVPLPPDYVINDDSHGGFDACCNRDKTPGYPWYFFVGPPKIREKIPMDEIFDNFWKPGSVEPVPGRIKTDSHPSEGP